MIEQQYTKTHNLNYTYTYDVTEKMLKGARLVPGGFWPLTLLFKGT